MMQFTNQTIVCALKKNLRYSNYMRTHGEMTLEKHKLFPYIAWALIILFALFTIKLALDLQTSTNRISTRTEQLEMLVDDNSSRLNKLEKSLGEIQPE